jgi:cytoskeletal protein RodZ
MPEPVLDLGSRLRMARHRQRKSLHEVSAATKIPTMWLEAIERNDLDRLPGGLYRRAYIPSFAAEVGASLEWLPDLAEADPAGRSTEPGVHDRGAWERHVPTLVAVLLLVSALALLHVMRGADGGPPQAAPTTSLAGEGDAAKRAASSDSMTGRPSAGSGVSLELRFIGPSWLSASTDGERVVHRLVAPGERVALDAHEAIAADIGDAGAVEASVNGGESRLVGEPGQLRRLEVRPAGDGRPAGGT